MESAGIVLNAICSRHHFIYKPAGKKSGRTLAGRLFFSPPTVAACVWFIQCICTAVVLGYSISICLLRNDIIYFPEMETADIAHCRRRLFTADDSKRKC